MKGKPEVDEGKPEDYEGYDEWLCKRFNMTLEEMYGEHIFKDRNLGLVEFIMKDKPKAIFEFACAYGFLALEVKKKLQEVTYVCTNFMPDVVQYVIKQGLTSFVFDANDIPTTDLSQYDAFVCTSLEHLKNDVEILGSLPKAVIYFCVTNMYDRTHVWTFKDEWEVYDRYKDVMRIIDYKIFNENNRIKMIGRGMND